LYPLLQSANNGMDIGELKIEDGRQPGSRLAEDVDGLPMMDDVDGERNGIANSLVKY